MPFSRVFAVLVFLSPLLSGCIPDAAEAARLEERLNEKIEVATGVNMLYSDSASLRVMIAAPTMEIVQDVKDPHQRFPDGLRVVFLGPAGDTSSVLTAKSGVYREQKNEVVVSDSVVWQSVEQQKLETDELTWDEAGQRIFTDRFVVVTQPDYIIYGYGLDAKQDFSEAKVRQVTGRVPIDRPEQ